MSPTPRDLSEQGCAPIVRAADVADASCIARIYNHHVDIGGATFDTEHWPTDEVIRMIQAEPPDAWFVAVQGNKVTGDELTGGEMLGWASARRYSFRHGYRFTLETAIYLDPVAIGRGVADLLQNQVDDHCRLSGIHHAVAKITASNERSIAFHHRYGYETVGIQKEIGHMKGEWMDVAIMQKIF